MAAIVPVSVSYIVVVSRIKSITDVFSIKKELMYTNRITLCCVGVFLMMSIVSAIIGERMLDSAPMVCVHSFVTCTAGGFILLLNAKYIIVSAEKHGDGGRRSESESNIHSVLAEYNIPDMSLSDILEDRTGFEAFIKHLVQEFSVENLLV